MQNSTRSATKVLIVDDHPVVLSGCRSLFASDNSVKIDEATDAKSGHRAYVTKRPDVTVIDIKLPDVSGFELMRRIRKDDPKGRDIMDHQSITYDYANGVKLSFTQLVFHPRSMPSGNQTINVYGTKGAVELMADTKFYSIDGKEQRLLAPKEEQKNDAHTTAFFRSILTGAPSPAGIDIGAAGALTAILGNQVCEQGKVINWSEFGVDV